MDVSLNGGTPKSSIFIGFSIINHPFWGTPIFGNPQMMINHSGTQYICATYRVYTLIHNIQIQAMWFFYMFFPYFKNHMHSGKSENHGSKMWV